MNFYAFAKLQTGAQVYENIKLSLLGAVQRYEMRTHLESFQHPVQPGVKILLGYEGYIEQNSAKSSFRSSFYHRPLFTHKGIL